MITVKSDGTLRGTNVFNEDGTAMKDVCKIVIVGDARQGVVTAEITQIFINPKLDFKVDDHKIERLEIK